jgi:3-hydroxyacyl-CoA dehydrogenase/enoyl-CoA hydratase/3-hydroxybutyryl-CoA epimerase
MTQNGKGFDGTHTVAIERRTDGVAILWMDVPEESVNTLRLDFADEFDHAFEELKNDDSVKAIVFASKKPDSFIVGADVRMLERVKTATEATDISRRAQDAMNTIEDFGKPVVAAIHGPCLGGGLEVALACRGRVASDHPKTRLGVPEVQLGLLPGAGGTQRLPRLVGLAAGLDLLLTGRQIEAKKARKLGLVDEVVPHAILLEVAAEHALALADKPHEKKTLRDYLRRSEIEEIVLADNPIGRKVVFDRATKELHEKTRGNYPAPERILEVVKRGLAKGMKSGLEAEREAFGELVVSAEAAQLMNIFLATTALKKDPGIDDPSIHARRVGKIAMLGAGLMGGGIAFVTANAGIAVRLKDRDSEGVLKGLAHVRSLVDGRVKRKKLSPGEGDRLMTYVTATTSYDGFRDADVVIEAVFEDLELKHRVLRETEAAAHVDTIFASNTSSLPITKIAEASARPHTVIGMHYFSPVEKMPLLEVIVTERTAPWVTATCVELGKRQGKTVIVVNDGVGFYTTRILAPFMNEAAHVLSEGVSIEAIDEALLDYGFPIGPIKLTDEVGIDVGEKVGRIMVAAFGDRLEAPQGLERLVASGRKGKKNGKGFYLYGDEKAKRREVDPSVYDVLGVEPTKKMDAFEIAERCTLQMVNEAARCYGEGILRSARDGDIGAIFGLGFPPFRGGPFRLVDSMGADVVVRKLERFRDLYGKRFEPAPVLRELGRLGKGFYDDAVRPGTFRSTAPFVELSAT